MIRTSKNLDVSIYHSYGIAGFEEAIFSEGFACHLHHSFMLSETYSIEHAPSRTGYTMI